jgi:GR25 family glycosyltransferase involved in LPS biosynthesis
MGVSAERAIRAFYLNLDQEMARRHSIEDQLACVGIPAERIDAVDGSKPLPPELCNYFDAKHVMDVGALGCYASHIKAWRQITLKALPHALVLEDDAILPPGLSGLLSDIIAALPRGWDMVHLGTEPDRAVCEIAKVGHRKIVQFSRATWRCRLFSFSGRCPKTPASRATSVADRYRHPAPLGV